MINIHEKGADELAAKLKRMGGEFDGFMFKTMDKATKYVHSRIPKYPPKPEPGSMVFVSDKQRRYVMWAIRAGVIEVPYRRRASGGLGGSITTEVRGIGAETVGLIGTNLDYAPYVISETGPQARIHSGRWWTLQQVARDSAAALREFFTREIDRYINR